jgi:hypothetical protein
MNKRDQKNFHVKKKRSIERAEPIAGLGTMMGREREKTLRDGSGKVTSGSAHDFLPFA